jgi:squalene synthase HpnC
MSEKSAFLEPEMTAIETPSGKTSRDENFPVASRFLSAEARPLVMAYYAFARAADDIADDPDLAPEEKIARLRLFEAALLGHEEAPELEKAVLLGRLLRGKGIDLARASDLLIAFRQDANNKRYVDWEELRGYCRRSAEPVGRFLLDLHGEHPSLYPASDALSSALQVLNHLQDLGEDWRRLGRLYLPADWMAQKGAAPEDLKAFALTPALRKVVDSCLERTASLLALADPLPAALASGRLSAQAAVTVSLAKRLQRRLEKGDPLAQRIKLSRADVAKAGAVGLLRGGLRL